MLILGGRYRRLSYGIIWFLLLAAPATAQRTHASRLDAHLRQLADAPATSRRAERLRALLSSGDSVAVTIQLTAAPRILTDLKQIGARAVNRRGSILEAYVPIAALPALEKIEGIARVEPILRPRYLATSQGVSAHNATSWHDAGRRGQGVKVGIIDSFDNYAPLVGSEVPSPANVRCYVAVGSFNSNLADCADGSVHGTAVAETLVDVAPDVQLYLADPQSLLDFRASVEWMVSQGVRIINHSAAWTWQGPGDGTSPYSSGSIATAEFAATNNVLFVSAAGNEQRSTWSGGYSDSDADKWLDFSGGAEMNGVTLGAGELFMAQARWQDSWSNSARDIDLYLFDQNGQIVAASDNAQAGSAGHTPFEFLAFSAPVSGTYYLGLYHFGGTVPGWIQAQAFTGETLQFWTPGSSIANPAESANPGVLAVGATHWGSTSTIASYSSQGPTRDGRVKPDIVGIAGADTVSYGPSAFGGTSQATPHVAGLAALVLGANPSFTAVQLAAHLKGAAQPRGAVPNNTWGYGFAFLGTPPCGYALASSGQYFFAAGGGNAIGLQVSGPACPWSASTSAGWISLTGGASGNGSSSYTYSVTPNGSNSRRSATITIGGLTFLVRQAGVPMVPSPDDIDGDGHADVLLQHDDGSLAVWFMDDSYLIDGAMLDPPRVDPSWRIVGTGDANGNGKADIFWQHPSGALAIWHMNGRTLVEGVQVNGQLPAGWQVRAVADLSGDGKPDLVLQHADGSLAAWYMNGSQIIDGRYMTPGRVDPAWHIVGAGDVDRDGAVDLFFQHQGDGTLAAWFMNGTTLRDGEYISPARVADQGWRVRGVTDLNSDGRPDLLWQHSQTGALAGWVLTATTLLDGAVFDPPSLGDLRWHIVGPR